MFDLFIEPDVHAARHTLPGHVRQRIRTMLEELAKPPRPPASRSLNVDGAPPGVEIRRIRLARWRIVYAIHVDEQWVWVLAIRQRPPYDYDDLSDLVARLPP